MCNYFFLCIGGKKKKSKTPTFLGASFLYYVIVRMREWVFLVVSVTAATGREPR